jgi:hypothetical protein
LESESESFEERFAGASVVIGDDEDDVKDARMFAANDISDNDDMVDDSSIDVDNENCIRITSGGFDVRWKVLESDIVMDVRLNKADNKRTKIFFDQIDPGSCIDGLPAVSMNPMERGKNFFHSYFFSMFPLDQVKRILEGTNENIGRSGAHLDAKELFAFLGLLLSMALIRLPNRKQYWLSSGVETKGPVSSSYHDFASYMQRSRFDFLLKHFALRKAPCNDAEKSDAWFMVREFVAGFNGWRKKIVQPSSFVCVDESMIIWTGADETSKDGMPHVTVILRKPEPAG